MGFHEIRFPDDVTYGTRFGPGFSTGIVRVDSGAEERSARWAAPLHRGNAALGVRTLGQLDQVRDFYLGRRGPANGFRWKDFRDYASTSSGRTPDTDPDAAAITDTDQNIGTGDGDTTVFQLRKTYVSGSESLERPIEKPVALTVVVAVNGSSQTEGADFTVNTTTGEITFAIPPGVGEPVTAGFEFDVPVRFGQEVDEDGLIASIESFGHGTIPDIPIVEIRSEKPVVEAFPTRGSKGIALSGADYSVSMIEAVLYRITSNDGTSGIRLPDPAALVLAHGGPYFVIVNEGANGVPLKDQDLNTIETIPAGETREVWLSGDLSALADQTLILKDTVSDLDENDIGDISDQHHVLSAGTDTPGTISISIGSFDNEHLYCISPAGVPNVAQWATGDWTSEFDISNIGGSPLIGSVAIIRWDDDLGSVAESSGSTPTQDIAGGGAGLYTFTHTGLSWSAGKKTDRIIVDFFLQHSGGGNASCDIETGTTDAEHVTPVVDQNLLQRWVSVGG